MRSAISSTSFSLWLMKMIDFPSALQAADDLEQLAGLLRRQHRRRLVEDEDVGAAEERLQDLDPLLLPDRDRADERGRVDDEPELLRQLAHPRLRPALVEEDLVARLHAEDDVLGHGHHRDEHEVLVHHPDPGLDRVPRRAEADRLPVQEDLARVVLVEPVEDVHQRRLAGAVLAEERVHLAPAHVEARRRRWRERRGTPCGFRASRGRVPRPLGSDLIKPGNEKGRAPGPPLQRTAAAFA